MTTDEEVDNLTVVLTMFVRRSASSPLVAASALLCALVEVGRNNAREGVDVYSALIDTLEAMRASNATRKSTANTH
jgi:hypothetical protein